LEGQRVGYPTRELVTAYDHLTGIITDNSSFVDYLVGTFAFERKLFHSLRQPIVQAVPPVERSADAETVGVLWAGRLVRQKRPDILIRVAEAAKSLPVHFHVYGEPQRESREYVRKLTGLKNVSYHGVFEGFDSLPVRTFDIFLYTAQWDGTPNVVLEAMGSGMACIAPRIGGIPESIDESNGCLVSEPGAISEYIHFLSDLCSDRRMLRAKGFAAAKKMSRDNSWTGFVEALTSIPDYGLRSSEAAPRRDPEEVA
jgi:glycosyltransferase involved in cell wall biosynthesis